MGGTTEPNAASGSCPAWIARVEKPDESVMLVSLRVEQAAIGVVEQIRSRQRFRHYISPAHGRGERDTEKHAVHIQEIGHDRSRRGPSRSGTSRSGESHFSRRLWHPGAESPGGIRGGVLRSGLFLGGGEAFLADAWRDEHSRRVRRWLHAESHVRGSVQCADRPYRS